MRSDNTKKKSLTLRKKYISAEKHPAYGMWKERKDMVDVDKYMKIMRHRNP